MKILDTRRITGPSLFTEKPGAMLDVEVSDIRQAEVLQVWEKCVAYILNLIGWGNEKMKIRCYSGGISLYFSAPIDTLYSACSVNEVIWDLTYSVLNGGELFLDPEKLTELKNEISDELNPPLIAMKRAASEHQVRFLQSDDIVSIGTGTGSQQFEVDSIPTPDEIDWNQVSDVPAVLITGTNGKSTTVRLMEAILTTAGIQSGASSTDGIRIAKQTVESGDYSGPEGARATLRNTDVKTAVLEIARGGMLRRGLPVKNVQAAIITNVAEDHLGEYGVQNLSDMVETKFIIRHGLAADGILVLNADDAEIVNYAKNVSQEICWFSLDAADPTVYNHVKKGGKACTIEDGQIIYFENGIKTTLLDHRRIPITMNGAAVHNSSNCLGAISLAKALGVENETIADSLRTFGRSHTENPGRGNIFKKNGYTILLDFAHNPHGMNALVTLVKNIPAKRKLLLIGQAGDRSNDDIAGLVKSAAQIKPDQVIIAEIPKYLRGRKAGEIPNVISTCFLENGINEKAIQYADDILDGIKKSIQYAEQDDLLILLCLDQKKEAFHYIENEVV